MTTRRDFVRALARAGTLGGVGMLPGCRLEERPDEEADRRAIVSGDTSMGADSGLPLLDRPLLRPWADDIAWIAAPSTELPVAYVSMARRHVYVDHDYRDRAAWLLDAHISVSTAHWRIPLPGDEAGVPITPGDSIREFEEFGIRQWDAGASPSMDDIRIVRGRRAARAVDFACIPMVGGAWYRAGPWSVDVAVGGSTVADVTREDFRMAGAGFRFADRECAAQGEAVQFVMWSCGDDPGRG